MKTKRSLVVRVAFIAATLLLTACAQPEQSSLAGDWLLTHVDKKQVLEGSAVLKIAPSRCKTNCHGDNLPDNTRRWQVSDEDEKAVIYLHDMSAQEKAGLNPGWQCYTSFFMLACQGSPAPDRLLMRIMSAKADFLSRCYISGLLNCDAVSQKIASKN